MSVNCQPLAISHARWGLSDLKCNISRGKQVENIVHIYRTQMYDQAIIEVPYVILQILYASSHVPLPHVFVQIKFESQATERK